MNLNPSLPQGSVVADTISRRNRLKKVLGTTSLYIALCALAIIYVLPFFYMVSLSFRTTKDAMHFPPTLLPNPFTLQGYRTVFEQLPVGQYTFNSFKIAIISTLGSLLVNSMAAFAFARIKFKGREILFSLLLATTFVPGQVRLIPSFIMFNFFGWIDSHKPLIIPAFFGGATGVFLLRQFFMGIPQDLEDAAVVDGANRFQIYYKIFLPMAGAPLATLTVLNFMNRWNALLGPLIYINDRKLRTLPLAIAFLVAQFDEMQYYVARLGLGTLTVLPLIVLYFAAQKYFVQGIARTGLKG